MGKNDEALEVCERIESIPTLKAKVLELKAAIQYEKNEFIQAMASLKLRNSDSSNPDFQSLVNEGCIFFKMEKHEKAIFKFKEAAKYLGGG